MYHSNYVATRMKMWKPSGEQKLLTLYAKMGIPLEQCQQRFSLMRKVCDVRDFIILFTFCHSKIENFHL
jgi:hypothetical protein